MLLNYKSIEAAEDAAVQAQAEYILVHTAAKASFGIGLLRRVCN
jgi:hypothetical protein